MGEDPAPSGASRRCFVALVPPLESARALLRAAHASLGVSLDELRLLDAEDVHLTLHFLGASAQGHEAALEAGFAGLASVCHAPRLRLGGGGAFPDFAAARVLWVGVEELEAETRLAALRLAVLDAVRAAGIDPGPTEHFRPHLTIGRVRSRSTLRVPRAFRELEWQQDWEAAELSWMETRPLSERAGTPRARYQCLARWKLGP